MNQAGDRTPPSLWRRFRKGGWYFVLTIATVGLAAAIPFWHATTKLHRARIRTLAIVWTGIGVAYLMLASLLPDRVEGQPRPATPAWFDVVMIGLLTSMVVACVLLRPIRHEVYGRPGHQTSTSDHAVAGALAARARRDEARELVNRDPALARDLGIGRPDLARGYDDGGLVDVNTASAELIQRICMVDRNHADAIVAARDRRGSFYNVGEVLIDVNLPPHAAAQLQERGITL